MKNINDYLIHKGVKKISKSIKYYMRADEYYKHFPEYEMFTKNAYEYYEKALEIQTLLINNNIDNFEFEYLKTLIKAVKIRYVED